jgi:outer membrane receptor protein involved in Fe transport
MVGAASAVVSASLAQAQPQSQQQTAAAVEEIVVTGSRIRTEGLVANSPITTLTAEEMAFSQPVAAEEIVKMLPAVVPAIGPGTNNGANGGATVDLRNLGEERTLVLIDGRRITPFNLDGLVDTNVVPVALLERVDLVTGGASAVYGADAVSGVVNFVFKRNFEGIQASGSYGISDESDARRLRGDVTMGGNFADDRGNVAISVGYTDTQALLQGRRPLGKVSLSSTTGLPQGSGTDVPAVIIVSPTPGNTGVTGKVNPATGLIGPLGSGFNFQPDNLYQSPIERYQFTALGSYDLTDWAEFYMQSLYTRSTVNTQLAASGTFLNVYQVPIGNPFIPQPMRNQICAARGIPAANCVAGNATEVPMTIGRRFTEFGPRLNEFQNKWF